MKKIVAKLAALAALAGFVLVLCQQQCAGESFGLGAATADPVDAGELYGLAAGPQRPTVFGAGLFNRTRPEILTQQAVCTDLNGDGICDQTGAPMFARRPIRPPAPLTTWQPAGELYGLTVTAAPPVYTAPPKARVIVKTVTTTARACTCGNPAHVWHHSGGLWTMTTAAQLDPIAPAVDGGQYIKTRTIGRRAAVYSAETRRFHRRSGRTVFFDGQGWYPGKLLGLSPR